MTLPVILSSGSGIAAPGAVQKVAEVPTGQTTIRVNPIDDGPHFATAESGVGGAHDTPGSGELCISPAGTPVLVRQGVNAGTRGTRNGDAPTGASWAIAFWAKPRPPREPSTSARNTLFRRPLWPSSVTSALQQPSLLVGTAPMCSVAWVILLPVARPRQDA